MAEFPGTAEARAAVQHAAGDHLSVGDTVPAVVLPALDSSAPAIRPEDLTGPATLVDFWAVWCTPCRAEVPVIRSAHERFAGRGFDVVSVSFDARREDVHRFRSREPMPWRHATT